MMNKTEFRALSVDEMRSVLMNIFEDDGEFLEMNKAELTKFGIENWDEDLEAVDLGNLPSAPIVVDDGNADPESDDPDSEDGEVSDPGDDDSEGNDSEDDVPEEEHPVRNLDLGYAGKQRAMAKNRTVDLG